MSLTLHQKAFTIITSAQFINLVMVKVKSFICQNGHLQGLVTSTLPVEMLVTNCGISCLDSHSVFAPLIMANYHNTWTDQYSKTISLKCSSCCTVVFTGPSFIQSFNKCTSHGTISRYMVVCCAAQEAGVPHL